MHALKKGILGLVVSLSLLVGVAQAGTWEQHGSPTTVTSGSPAHTKGAWVALTGLPLNINAGGGLVWLRGGSNTDRYLVDLGYSLPPYSTVITVGMPQNLLVQTGASADIASSAYIPQSVPRGAILYARAQSTTASSNVFVSFQVVEHEDGEISKPLSTLGTFGYQSANSSGISLDPGGVADTKSAWTQMVAPEQLTKPVRWVTLMFGGQTALSADARVRVDLGLGPTGEERVVMPDIMLRSDNESDSLIPSAVSVPMFIEAGTRISLRVSSGNTTATTREIDVVVVLFSE